MTTWTPRPRRARRVRWGRWTRPTWSCRRSSRWRTGSGSPGRAAVRRWVQVGLVLAARAALLGQSWASAPHGRSRSPWIPSRGAAYGLAGGQPMPVTWSAVVHSVSRPREVSTRLSRRRWSGRSGRCVSSVAGRSRRPRLRRPRSRTLAYSAAARPRPPRPQPCAGLVPNVLLGRTELRRCQSAAQRALYN